MDTSSQPHDSKASVSLAAADLRLYDTADHQVTSFRPIEPGKVGIYVCGATVQSSPHLGHIRTTLAFDVIRRWLLRLGYQVTLIRNVTDIDDKILTKAAANNQRWWERAYIYEREFTHAYDTMGVLPPTYEPRATGHIPEMIDLIQRIIDRGHAYVVPDEQGRPSGNVYFDVASWPEYGALTHQQTGTQPTDEQAAANDRLGPSIDTDEQNNDAEEEPGKRDPRDFALWKAPKPTDPPTARWQTPFGTGRPGWHLECSAAHRWMHTAWVTQKGEKMSKSLGNGLSVDQVLSQHPAWVVRYALVSVQYRSMLEWSDQSLQEAEGAYERISNFVDRAGRILGAQPERDRVAGLSADDLPEDFVQAMNDDINVSGGLAALYALIRQANAAMDADQCVLDRKWLANALLQVRAMLDVFGLDPLDPHWARATANRDNQAMNTLDTLVRQQLEERDQARKDHDFARADVIRDQLAAAGVTVADTPAGSTWDLSR